MSSGGELPVGTATFLFTDIEGSTRLERELRERYGEVLGEHRRLLRDAFARQACNDQVQALIAFGCPRATPKRAPGASGFTRD